MGISFHSPIYLSLLVLAIGLLVWWWRTQTRITGIKRYAVVGIRGLIFLLLILALAGIQLLFPVQEETLVFVVDRSASMDNETRVIPFLREAVEGKKAEDQYAIVSVGQEAVVEQPLTIRGELGSLGVVINPHATNLAEGIRVAAAMIPSQARGKIVLVSDGLETHGDALTELKLVTERGIMVEALSLQQDIEEEVLLSSLNLPHQLFAGEEFQVQVEVESRLATDGILRFYEGNLEVGRQAISIERGKNTYLFPQQAQHEGFHRYRVELQANRDTIQMNNQGHAFTQVLGAPKVLVLEGENGEAHNLVEALQAGNIQVDVKTPQLLPQELDGYKQYASIVLANVQATQINTQDMERIRTAVRDLGLGLIMTGGPNSFGMGGWFKTPIEEALPVSMDLKTKEELPSLGLVLVIDKSGSMSSGMGGPDKMGLAKEAALRATEMLNEKDQVSVVAFDGFPWAVVEMQSARNLEEIQDQISSIFAGGGTEIYSALAEGYAQADMAETQRKHVILLTDGQSGSYDDYESLLGDMLEENITVSTVAVGDDSDTLLLEDIAEWGQGRYYFANDPSSIPQIFSKETALASRTFIVEQAHIPELVGGRDWTVLRQDLPSIHAYIATSPKQTAEMALQSTEGDPVLARWQYGLGRSVAWTSDVKGEWSPYWASWEENSHFWNQIVSWTFPQSPKGNWKVNTEVEGVTASITVDFPTGTALPQQMEALVINQNLERVVVPLKPVQPGTLQGQFPTAEPGAYLVQVIEKEGENIIASETAGVNISYSPEYRLHQGGEERLQAWMEVAEGRLLSSAEEVFTGELPRKWNQQGMTNLLLMLVALLWPIDVAVRRVQLPLGMKKERKQYKRDDRKENIVYKEAVNDRKAFTPSSTSMDKADDEQKQVEEDPFARLLEAKRKKS